ncbi:MAG: histidine kinase, partial [Bacteroidetes bacterium HGW-Bacteroidetes-22]
TVMEPKVSISLSCLDTSVRVTITDNGSGIKEAIAGDIFVPFFTTKPKGTGIGLSLSREIATRHGGMISLDTTSSTHLTTFVISLPI